MRSIYRYSRAKIGSTHCQKAIFAFFNSTELWVKSQMLETNCDFELQTRVPYLGLSNDSYWCFVTLLVVALVVGLPVSLSQIAVFCRHWESNLLL